MCAIGPTAQGQTEFNGRLLEQVVCEAEAAQSYALYVPSNYRKDRKWPVIFCFDASARGLVPVQRFQAAAEKYGYLVAGSLTSRNGPTSANSAAIKAMIRDVSGHFSVDPQRVYTAGVSGGARVATAVALAGVAKGVIACAAGFPESPDGIPRKIPFVFYGTTGTEDFNWGEMVRLDRELEQRKAVHRLIVFDGGHEWASAALMTEAVEWLELQAMRNGTRTVEREFVDAQWRARVAAVPAEPGAPRWRELKSLVADFAGLKETAACEKEAQTLGSSREIRAGLKTEQTLMAQEAELLEQLGDVADASTARKKRFATELRAKADGPDDSGERRMVRRAIAGFCSMTRSNVRPWFEGMDYAKAADHLELAAILRPGTKATLFDLARARAYHGEEGPALEALEQASGAGFDDLRRLEEEPAFAQWRTRARYRALLAKISASAVAPAVVLPVMRISASLANVELRMFYLPNTGGGSPRLALLGVETVRPESLAARAGLIQGMEVMAIQGIRIRGLTDTGLERTMQLPAANEIVLSVRGSPSEEERELRIPVQKPRGQPMQEHYPAVAPVSLPHAEPIFTPASERSTGRVQTDDDLLQTNIAEGGSSGF